MVYLLSSIDKGQKTYLSIMGGKWPCIELCCNPGHQPLTFCNIYALKLF